VEEFTAACKPNAMSLVKLGIAHVTSSALVEKGRNIIIKMTGNVDFPAPMPPLAEITAAVDALETANALVLLNGGKQEYEGRRVALAVYSKVLHRLAGHVSSVAGDDRGMILSSGFEARKRAERLGRLPAPTNVRAIRTPFPKQVELRWDAVHGRSAYQVWMTDGDPTVESGWKLVAQTTRNSYTATDLIAPKYYSFRVAAFGTAGSSPMSASAMALAA